MHKAFTWLGGLLATAGAGLLAHGDQIQTVVGAVQTAMPTNRTIGVVATAVGIVLAMAGHSVVVPSQPKQ